MIDPKTSYVKTLILLSYIKLCESEGDNISSPDLSRRVANHQESRCLDRTRSGDGEEVCLFTGDALVTSNLAISENKLHACRERLHIKECHLQPSLSIVRGNVVHMSNDLSLYAASLLTHSLNFARILETTILPFRLPKFLTAQLTQVLWISSDMHRM